MLYSSPISQFARYVNRRVYVSFLLFSVLCILYRTLIVVDNTLSSYYSPSTTKGLMQWLQGQGFLHYSPSFYFVESKGMWGSRKKKDKEKGKGKDKRSKSDDDEMKDMEALYEELLSSKNNYATTTIILKLTLMRVFFKNEESSGAKDTAGGRRRRATITSPAIASADSDSVNSLSHLVELYFSAAEKLIESDEFEKLANPENLQRLVAAVPVSMLWIDVICIYISTL
jgi:hypothetical protein